MPGDDPRTTAWSHGTMLLLLGVAAVCALVLLEATEGTSVGLLPAGSLDSTVDAALSVAACLCLGRGLLASASDRADRRAPGWSALGEAVAHLDAADPEARTGALRDLEFIGQAAPDRRQAVVDEWCAVLRRPPAPGDAPARVTAQQLIAHHLRPVEGDGVFDPWWPEVIEVDLTGAALVDLDLRACRLPDVGVVGAVLGGASAFDGARFDGRCAFDAATFLGAASFAGTTFVRDAAFFSTRFDGPASFRGARFAGAAHFDGTDGAAGVDLTDARTRRRSGHRLPEGWTCGPVDGDGWVTIVPGP